MRPAAHNCLSRGVDDGAPPPITYDMSRALRAAAGAAALVLATAAPAFASGPITSIRTVSRTALRPGVYLTHLRASVRGFSGRQDLWRVSWPIGDSHVALHTELRGDYDPASRSIADRAISGWAASHPTDLVAAMTGDFSTPTSWRYVRSTVSGLLVHNGRVFSWGWGGPGVGYKGSGSFVFGQPTAVPAKLALPGGRSATVGAFGTYPSGLRGDQVAVYTGAGTPVVVPTGAIGVIVDSSALRGLLRGTRAAVNSTGGLGVRETVAGFRFDEPSVTPIVTAMPIARPSHCPTRVCAAGAHVLVPAGGAVILAPASGPAAQGLTALAGSASGAVSLIGSPARWAGVADVSGGKPMLVEHGVAISRQPSYVDDWQWSCAGGCWRTALARSATRGWLIVGGRSDGGGITMPVWAHMLAQLGASNALGFDANNSAELYMPGRTPVTGYGYERDLPTLTALTFTP